MKASDHPSYNPATQGYMTAKLVALVAATNAKKGR